MFKQKILALCVLFLAACSSSNKFPGEGDAPDYSARNLDNACDILLTDSSWKDAFTQTYKKYGVPAHLIMAFIYQESRFRHDAQAKTSTAYGYPQAKTKTWQWYQDSTGNTGSSRSHLPDAVDFIGWYVSESQKRTNVSKWNAREQYLAYHDGTGGYLRNTHANKSWLLAIADKVNRRAATYRKQLGQCFSYPK